MAEAVVSDGGAIFKPCTAEEEVENLEQQTDEKDMVQSIFEGQFVSLNSTEYIVSKTF